MKYTHYKQVEPNKNPHGVDVRPIYNEPDAQLMHMILEPGQGLNPHITPVDVFIYVLEGVATVHIGDEQVEAIKDMIVESPKNLKHWIVNNSTENARLLVCKTPRPDKPAKLL